MCTVSVRGLHMFSNSISLPQCLLEFYQVRSVLSTGSVRYLQGFYLFAALRALITRAEDRPQLLLWPQVLRGFL